MIITYNGRTYKFRECDTRDIKQEELQVLANEKGKLQYEPRTVWLIVPGI